MRMTEIKPRWVDGEPVCSGVDCPHFNNRLLCDGEESRCRITEWGIYINQPCIPALRQRIEELEADLDKWEDLDSDRTQRGPEAEALRQAFEKIASRDEDENPITGEEIMDVLDTIDAGDALRFLISQPSATRQGERCANSKPGGYRCATTTPQSRASMPENAAGTATGGRTRWGEGESNG